MAKATGPRGADLPRHTLGANDLLTRTGRTVGSTATTPLPPRTDPGRLSFEPEATPQRRAAQPDARPWEAPAPPDRLAIEESANDHD